MVLRLVPSPLVAVDSRTLLWYKEASFCHGHPLSSIVAAALETLEVGLSLLFLLVVMLTFDRCDDTGQDLHEVRLSRFWSSWGFRPILLTYYSFSCRVCHVLSQVIHVTQSILTHYRV
jgi:hypothetical protein